ncbi:hypothetical protein ACQ4M3_26235 [Leptolyngbya sp. AN03gr2]|uniref:hypothetical protein n=1 Tax=unclassified Leptolyngbya TaxID=2650499 RepID=UPI003D30F5CE
MNNNCDFSEQCIFIGKHEAAKLIGFAPDTLKKFRAKGLLREGIHWIRVNSRSIRYNKSLLLDWMINRNDLHAHERAIAIFFENQPSNQKKAWRKSKRPSDTMTF